MIEKITAGTIFAGWITYQTGHIDPYGVYLDEDS